MRLDNLNNAEYVKILESATELKRNKKYMPAEFVEAYIGLFTAYTGFYGRRIGGSLTVINPHVVTFDESQDITLIIEGRVELKSVPVNTGVGNIAYSGFGYLIVNDVVIYDGRGGGGSGTPGPPGPPGQDGQDGDSAYQIWLNLGNSGTEQDFVNSLQGIQGVPGNNGTDGQPGTPGQNGQDGSQGAQGNPGADGQDGANGLPGQNGTDGTDGTNGQDGAPGTPGSNGQDGADGESAYQAWLDLGNTGTEQDFIDSLQGTPGAPGQDGTDGQDGLPGTNGTNGTDGTNGIDGDSAYQVWLNNGNTGTEQNFLDSIKGDQGIPGNNGNDGAPGNPGSDGTDGTDGVDGTNGTNGSDGAQGPAGPPTTITAGTPNVIIANGAPNEKVISVVQTTAGLLQNVFFTGQTIITSEGTFGETLISDKGSVGANNQTVTLISNQIQAFNLQFLGQPSPAAGTIIEGDYLAFPILQVSTNQNNQRFKIEAYLCDIEGVPTGAGAGPTGTLGFPTILIADSGIVDLQANNPTGVPCSGNVPAPLPITTNERFRYVIVAERIGNGTNNKVVTFFCGNNYNSYFQIPGNSIISGFDPNALHTNIAEEINNLPAKVTPIATDFVVIEDSADDFKKKKVEVSNFLGGSPGPISGILGTFAISNISQSFGSNTIMYATKFLCATTINITKMGFYVTETPIAPDNITLGIYQNGNLIANTAPTVLSSSDVVAGDLPEIPLTSSVILNGGTTYLLAIKGMAATAKFGALLTLNTGGISIQKTFGAAGLPPDLSSSFPASIGPYINVIS